MPATFCGATFFCTQSLLDIAARRYKKVQIFSELGHIPHWDSFLFQGIYSSNLKTSHYTAFVWLYNALEAQLKVIKLMRIQSNIFRNEEQRRLEELLETFPSEEVEMERWKKIAKASCLMLICIFYWKTEKQDMTEEVLMITLYKSTANRIIKIANWSFRICHLWFRCRYYV